MRTFLVKCELRVDVSEFEVEANSAEEAEQKVTDEWSLCDFDKHISSWEVNHIEAEEEK